MNTASLVMTASAGGNATNQTAQGIMVNLKPTGTFAIDTTNIYPFDQVQAAPFFSNAWDGNAPSYSCNGSACNGDLCGIPLAPSAPAPDSSKVANPGGSGVADKSRCTFLDGGVLTLTDSYKQQAAPVPVACVVGYNNKGNPITKDGSYTFTYTYAIAPISSDPVVAFTSWPLDQVNSSGLCSRGRERGHRG